MERTSKCQLGFPQGEVLREVCECVSKSGVEHSPESINLKILLRTMGGIGFKKFENHCQLAPISHKLNILVVNCALGMHIQEINDRNGGNCQPATADQLTRPNFKPPNSLRRWEALLLSLSKSSSTPLCPALHCTAAYPAFTRDYLSLGFLSKSD